MKLLEGWIRGWRRHSAEEDKGSRQRLASGFHRVEAEVTVGIEKVERKVLLSFRHRKLLLSEQDLAKPSLV